MKVYRSINFFPNISEKIFFTLGVFDGLHLGHQKLISYITRYSCFNKNNVSVLLSFFPHPKNILLNKDIKYLTTIKEKIFLCKRLGINHLIIHPFDKFFSNFTYDSFINYLLHKINIKYFIIGYDSCLGKDRRGTFKKLKIILNNYNCYIKKIPALKFGNFIIKSSYIKHLLLNGKLDMVNKMLGYYYVISGIVIKGNSLGSKIGFPTANVQVPHFKLLPITGVYAVIILINNKKYYGMLNIGYSPTVNVGIKRIEVHIFNFNKSLYNKFIYIHLVKYIRKEYKFKNIRFLLNQLYLDQKVILDFF